MSAYRDSFEHCPRCGIELVEAGSVRGCQGCGGMWLREVVLTEMVLRMLPLGWFGRLVFAAAAGDGRTLACPTCHAAMAIAEMHGIVVDRCAQHGIWFDAHELEQVLRRAAEPDRPPIVGRETSLLPRPATPGSPPYTMRFRVRRGDSVVVTEVPQSVVKIGRLASAHVRLPEESGASRMHAVIELVDDATATVIDLGSANGTTVNGKRVNKARIVSGDVLGIGDATIVVEIVGSGTYPAPDRGA